nr:EamA family transporter [Lysinibacillus boronitolerans]
MAMSIVGSSVVAGKLVVQSFPIFLANELRFLVAAIILIPLWIKIEGFSTLNRKELVAVFFTSVIRGVFI